MPEWGPPVHRATLLHRLEHALLAVALAGAAWWAVAVADVAAWWPILLWAVAPDLVFLAIGPAARDGAWPPWGARLYNLAHTHVVALPVAAVAAVALHAVPWPLLGWFLHIEVDRAVGYDLRRSG